MMTPDQFALMMNQKTITDNVFEYREERSRPVPARPARRRIIALRRATSAVLASLAATLATAADKLSPAHRTASVDAHGLGSSMGCSPIPAEC